MDSHSHWLQNKNLLIEQKLRPLSLNHSQYHTNRNLINGRRLEFRLRFLKWDLSLVVWSLRKDIGKPELYGERAADVGTGSGISLQFKKESTSISKGEHIRFTHFLIMLCN